MDLEKRLLGIGGSDVAPILNISKFRTATEIWNEKVNAICNEQEALPHDPGTSLLYWGRHLEDDILSAYTVATGREVIQQKEQIHHKEHNWLLANIDGLAKHDCDDVIVEAKAVFFDFNGEWGCDGTEEIPKEYYLQVQHYLFVTGARRADVAVLINGVLRIYPIKFSQKIIDKIFPLLEKFWNYHVKNKIPPKASNVNDVKIIYKKSSGEEKTAGNEHIEKVALIKDWQERQKEFQEKIDKYKKDLAEHMQDASTLVDDDGNKLVTFNTRKDGARVFKVY